MLNDDINKVIVSGRIANDLELKYTKSGSACLSFNIGSNRAVKKNDQWSTNVEWIRVSCFGKVAESVVKKLSKGERVIVVGTLQTKTWTDKNNKEHKFTEVVVDFNGDIHNFKSKSNAENKQTSFNEQIKNEVQQNEGVDDDDLPF